MREEFTDLYNNTLASPREKKSKVLQPKRSQKKPEEIFELFVLWSVVVIRNYSTSPALLASGCLRFRLAQLARSNLHGLEQRTLS